MKRLGGPGSETLQNGTETEHSRIYNLEFRSIWAALGPEMIHEAGNLELSGRPWADMIQNATGTDHLEHLEGLGPK